jgi:hypothetical protein
VSDWLRRLKAQSSKRFCPAAGLAGKPAEKPKNAGFFLSLLYHNGRKKSKRKPGKIRGRFIKKSDGSGRPGHKRHIGKKTFSKAS